jgi:hypothetical protein
VKLTGKAKKGGKEGGLTRMRQGRNREKECARTVFIDGLC